MGRHAFTAALSDVIVTVDWVLKPVLCPSPECWRVSCQKSAAWGGHRSCFKDVMSPQNGRGVCVASAVWSV